MSKNITDMPPVGIEHAVVHMAQALRRDGWDDGIVAVTFDTGRINTLTRHHGTHCDDFFMHDGERWGRRTEYEGGAE